jgi:hypothetical protein
VIFAIAMSAVRCPKNGSSYTLHGVCVVFLQPRRFEEHDFGNILDLACNDNVTLKRDNLTSSSNANEGIGSILCELSFVVTEKDLANEQVWTQFDRSFEDDSNTSRTEKMILLVSNKVILQDVQADSFGDAVEVVHETSDVVVGDSDINRIILDIDCNASHRRHCEGIGRM